MQADEGTNDASGANGAHRTNGNGNGHGNGSNGHDKNSVNRLVGGGKGSPPAVSDVDAKSDGKVEIMVPGAHVHPRGPVEVTENDFADAVLCALPEYLLYRTGRTIGVLTGQSGSREFYPSDTRHLRLFASTHTRLVKWNRTEKGNPFKTKVLHGNDLASLILGQAELSDRVRRLDRIVHYPAYGRSFELLRPGWTEGTLYDPPDELKDLQPETNREVITQTLDDLTIDFPFLEEDGDGGAANRENFYGLLLTPIVRTALEGNIPLHLVNAPLERTGKSKLVEEVLGGIILGTQMAALQQVGEGEEFDKRVLGLLKQAETLVHLDNVNDGLAPWPARQRLDGYILPGPHARQE